jgi:hypothetical protein
MNVAVVFVLSLALAGSAAAHDWRHRDRPARAFGPKTEHVIGGRAVTSDWYRSRRFRDRDRGRERIIVIERELPSRWRSERRWR